MPQPNLLHPVPVTIEQKATATTVYDEDAREPVGDVERTTPVIVEGQAKWRDQFAVDMEPGGIQETSDGYVLFRRVDLDAESVTLQVFDRITRIGNIDTDVYITRLEWTGHYPDQGGPTMVKAHFADRQPAKQER